MQEVQDPAATYNSNPFTLAFDAIGRFFHTNLAWAIVMIVIGFFGTIAQVTSSVIDQSSTKNSSSPSSLEQEINTDNIDTSRIITIVIIVVVVALVVAVVAAIVGTFVNGMYAYVALQSEKLKPVSFSEAFSAVSNRFFRLFFASLLANLKIFGWMLLFIIPGIIATFRYALLPYVIMAEDSEEKGVGSAHEQTKQLVKGRLMEVFGISFVGGIIPIVGGLLTIAGNAALYRQLKFSADHNTQKPKIHFLNYIGLILLSVFLLFVALIIVLALIALGFTQ